MQNLSWQQFQLAQLLLGNPQQGGGAKGGAKGRKAKGKGKGIDHDDKGQKGKGGVKGAGKGKTDKDKAEEECLCCGKQGHLKKTCWHKDKKCTICGIAGHLSYMCKQGEDQNKDCDNKDDKKAKEEKVPWECYTCWATNADEHVLKCRTKDCKGESPKKSFKDVLTDTPSALSKNTKKLMSDEDAEAESCSLYVYETDIQQLKQQIEGIEALNEKAAKRGEKNLISTEHLKERLKDYEKRAKAKKDNAPAIRSIMGDRSRESHNFDVRETKLKDQLEQITDRLAKSVEKQKEKKDAEEDRHKKALDNIEKGFETQRRVLKQKKEELEETIKKEAEEHKPS